MNVSIKVIDVNTPHQDVFVADCTGTIRVCLWNDNFDSLKKGHSYDLANLTVREFRSTKYLNMPKSGADIIPIPDLGNVADPPPKEENTTTIKNVQIVGVPALHIYKACLQCKARVEPCTPPFGRCSKEDCSMIQRYDLCTEQATAKLLPTYESGDNHDHKYITLNAFGQLVMQLACDKNVTAKLTSVTYVTEKRIMTSFEQ